MTEPTTLSIGEIDILLRGLELYDDGIEPLTTESYIVGNLKTKLRLMKAAARQKARRKRR